MTITKERDFDFIYEHLVKNDHSKLSNDLLILNKKSDTLIDNKKCELFKFEMPYTNHKGKAALWKGIPLWVHSELDKGIFENVNLITLDLTSKIPVEKTKIMDYVDTE